jgi:hypothetical protein
MKKNAPILKSKDEILDIISIMRVRKNDQVLKGEDINSFLHLSFEKQHKVHSLASGLNNVIQLGFQSTNNDKYVIPDYQRNLVWKLENKQHLISAIMRGSPIGDFILSRKEVYTTNDFYYEWEVIDGQQRINTLREFVKDGFKDMDGRLFSEYSYREMKYLVEDFNSFRAFYLEDITQEDAVNIYISRNVGGVAHTEDELNKAKEYLQTLK